MKSGFIMGTTMFYIFMLLLEAWLSGGNTISVNQQYIFNTLVNPSIVDQNNIVTAFTSFIVGIGTYFIAFLGMIMLWSPTIYSGYLIYFYWLLCLPASITVIVTFVVPLLRGRS